MRSKQPCWQPSSQEQYGSGGGGKRQGGLRRAGKPLASAPWPSAPGSSCSQHTSAPFIALRIEGGPVVRVERGVQAEPQGQVRVCDEQAANGDQVGVACGMGRGPARDGAGTGHLLGQCQMLSSRCAARAGTQTDSESSCGYQAGRPACTVEPPARAGGSEPGQERSRRCICTPTSLRHVDAGFRRAHRPWSTHQTARHAWRSPACTRLPRSWGPATPARGCSNRCGCCRWLDHAAAAMRQQSRESRLPPLPAGASQLKCPLRGTALNAKAALGDSYALLAAQAVFLCTC